MTKSTLRTQLGTLRDRISNDRKSKVYASKAIPSAMSWKEDGEDHINISLDSETELGSLLYFQSELDFTHTVFGYFRTMESFWTYIRSKERDDRIRTMPSYALRFFARKLTTIRIANFRAIIMDSEWQRIRNYKPLLEEIKKCQLPFDAYYINDNGLRIRYNYFEWYLSGYEEIRKALNENRAPDFTFLLDIAGSDIYYYAIQLPGTDRFPKVKFHRNDIIERKPKSSND